MPYTSQPILRTLLPAVRAAGARHLSDGVASAAGAVGAALALDPPEAAFAALWWLLVVRVVRSDLASLRIPDAASLGIAVLAALHVVTLPLVQGEPPDVWLQALAWALASGLVAFNIAWAASRICVLATGRHGLGFGDVKLAGACAIWLTVGEQIAALQLAALAALMLALLDRGGATRQGCGVIAFGAFMAPAAWLIHLTHLLAPDLPGGPS